MPLWIPVREGEEIMAKHSRRTFQGMYEAWREAIADGKPVTAKANAQTLLDAIKYLGPDHEPKWPNSRARTFFFNWCEREGLLPPNGPKKNPGK